MEAQVYPLTMLESLRTIRNALCDDLEAQIQHIPTELLPSSTFFASLNDQDRTTAFRFCLLAWYSTHGTEVPRELQLRAALSAVEQDSLLIAGTGSGKTHVMALLILLNDDEKRVVVTISPLKRLQVTQVSDFKSKYGINTLAINDETPRNKDYWRIHVHNGKKDASQDGTAKHLIVTAEQLFKSREGHWTRLSLLLRDKAFRARILRINVDEAHFLFFAGTSRYGVQAFRPCWGRLDDLKVTLPQSILWHGFTATCPPHIQTAIEASFLRSGYPSESSRPEK
ncbi:hypothetical protein ARMSODRAFT_1021264 [Armillaria solidipes]|uniref:DNA 3'-5' helicase n=1 Tax=Armillaria solidipes TaxID=1076256 RepID=A0A2H3BSK2_9AGAR|nr:hypothetical protein ARMSODRAFT_1021264 [Armillaria solidipes]